jgi:hydroxypyruvate isomerase
MMKLCRRRMLQTSAGAGLAAALETAHARAVELGGPEMRQSICRWCYGRIPLDQLAAEAKRIGYASIELLATPEEVKTVQAAGLTCAVFGRVDIAGGWNRPAHHARLTEQTKKHLDLAAEFNLPNVIVMAGNRTIRGETVADDEGLANCAKGLKEVVGYAEAKKVTIVMEGLNSKRDHKDYMYDKTAWGVELCKRIGSPRFKLLYDIYHMQIMEGDVVDTIRRYKDYLAHFHTGGVPGRNEIDETQELNYGAIMKAIRATGYAGYVGQEFIPKRDPLASLEQAFSICS